jgi:hypothetical protein
MAYVISASTTVQSIKEDKVEAIETPKEKVVSLRYQGSPQKASLVDATATPREKIVSLRYQDGPPIASLIDATASPREKIVSLRYQGGPPIASQIDAGDKKDQRITKLSRNKNGIITTAASRSSQRATTKNQNPANEQPGSKNLMYQNPSYNGNKIYSGGDGTYKDDGIYTYSEGESIYTNNNQYAQYSNQYPVKSYTNFVAYTPIIYKNTQSEYPVARTQEQIDYEILVGYSFYNRKYLIADYNKNYVKNNNHSYERFGKKCFAFYGPRPDYEDMKTREENDEYMRYNNEDIVRLKLDLEGNIKSHSEFLPESIYQKPYLGGSYRI